MFPDSYSILAENFWKSGNFELVPIRYEDRMAIMQWRNEQMYHLRQTEPLTADTQERYFTEVVARLFDQPQPAQLLFSFLENGVCIGYGGLVHINWPDQHAEISFIMNTALEQERFHELWTTYLGLIEQVAFSGLKLHKLFTYAYDLRPHLYVALEAQGFTKDAILPEHCFFDGRFIDVILHSKLNKPELRLRRAVENDSQLLFDWANDRSVRQNSINSEPIAWENHMRWFENRLNDPNTAFFIAESNSKPVGQIRLDRDDNWYSIGYSVAEEQRGKGFGKQLVALVMQEFPGARFKAVVKKDNAASSSIFEALGFALQANDPWQPEILTFMKES